MGNLIYHTNHLSKYVGGLKFKQKYKDNKFKQFPENYVSFHLRVADFKKQLKYPQESNVCLLIVTHGFVVR